MRLGVVFVRNRRTRGSPATEAAEPSTGRDGLGGTASAPRNVDRNVIELQPIGRQRAHRRIAEQPPAAAGLAADPRQPVAWYPAGLHEQRVCRPALCLYESSPWVSAYALRCLFPRLSPRKLGQELGDVSWRRMINSRTAIAMTHLDWVRPRRGLCRRPDEDLQGQRGRIRQVYSRRSAARSILTSSRGSHRRSGVNGDRGRRPPHLDTLETHQPHPRRPTRPGWLSPPAPRLCCSSLGARRWRCIARLTRDQLRPARWAPRQAQCPPRYVSSLQSHPEQRATHHRPGSCVHGTSIRPAEPARTR